MSLGQILQSIPGLASVRESEGLWWVEPERSIALTFFHLHLDDFQGYPNAKTGQLDPPGSYPGDPYWIGKWVDAGWAVLIDLQTASTAPPYRVMLTTEPYYISELCSTAVPPGYYGIVDAPPELAAKACELRGYGSCGGYGLVGEPSQPSLPTFPTIPGSPSVLSVPTLPELPSPGGYVPQPEPEPAKAATAPERPTWLVPAAAAGVGVGALYLMRKAGWL